MVWSVPGENGRNERTYVLRRKDQDGVGMKLDKSRDLWKRSKNSLAGGVSSHVRLDDDPFPLFFERAAGSKLIDVDGNEYIDYMLAHGPTILGHRPAFLIDVVREATELGQIFGAQHELEVEVSEMVQKLVPSAELVRFTASGTEAVQVALRVARAFTGRSKFIKFEGMYHGWLDSVSYSIFPPLDKVGAKDRPEAFPFTEGLPKGNQENIVVLPWNDADVLRETIEREAGDIAAIITEPIMCNCNCIVPKAGYMEEMRQLCDEHGIVLIFDEVITGFRFAPGGAQELLDITPDLSTFAKALGGGYPIAMLAGKKEHMSLLADGTAYHGGTMNSNVISMAASKAVLLELTKNDNAAYTRLYATGQALMEGFRTLASKHEVPMLVQGAGPVFALAFTDAAEITDYRSQASLADHDKYRRFRRGMLEQGVRMKGSGVWFVSTAHSDQDVRKTLDAADAVLAGPIGLD